MWGQTQSFFNKRITMQEQTHGEYTNIMVMSNENDQLVF